ncbi:hypothetical protein GCM10009606_39370 [Nocardioides aquiterrae]|uniref:GtrA/DPMS transmembrane domain-containing protein n=2 Tax=Nocardioides aquiterrae TaxID=203799 RepID=A0ABP4F6Z1_9ACTN
MLTFLAVGAAGYVTDVAAFNWFREQPVVGDPVVAKVAAVGVAMVVTYLGNRLLTWRELGSENRRREVALFAVFNLVGLLISVLALDVSHHLLGLTSRLADNISGNVVGVGLGTAFRFWAYRRFVFVGAGSGDLDEPLGSEQPAGQGPGQREQDRGGADAAAAL